MISLPSKRLSKTDSLRAGKTAERSPRITTLSLLKGPAEPRKLFPYPTPVPSVSLLLQNVCFLKEHCPFPLVQGHHFPLVQGQCLGHRLALPIIAFFCLKTKPNKTNPKPGPRLAGQPGPLRTSQLATTGTADPWVALRNIPSSPLQLRGSIQLHRHRCQREVSVALASSAASS